MASEQKGLAQQVIMAEKSTIIDGFSDDSKDAENRMRQNPELKRNLKARHIQMIAIGNKSPARFLNSANSAAYKVEQLAQGSFLLRALQ